MAPAVDHSSATPFEVVVKREAAALELRLRGELDIASEPRFSETLDRALGESDGLPVLVRLEQLTFIDSSGVRALVAAHRRAPERVRFTRGARAVGRILAVTGVDGLLPFAE